jgi:hypothetical protein
MNEEMVRAICDKIFDEESKCTSCELRMWFIEELERLCIEE